MIYMSRRWLYGRRNPSLLSADRSPPGAGRTLNGVLGRRRLRKLEDRRALALITIFSEGALLLVAAQTGFVDGPRVMAIWPWTIGFPTGLPRSRTGYDPETGSCSWAGRRPPFNLLAGPNLDPRRYVLDHVFLTFSLSEFGMSRFFVRHRKTDPLWKKHLPVHLTGLTLCLTILIITTLEKFAHGGWLTLLITSGVIALFSDKETL